MALKIYLALFVVSTTTILVTEAWPSLSILFASKSSEKCMDDIGCFQAVPPLFDFGIVYTLPEDRETIDTYFFLYTPENPDTPQIFSNINGNVSSIGTSLYNPKANTTFVVGGFISGTSGEWKMDMVDALLKENGNNVFLVVWDGGDGPSYDVAAANTRVVGAEIAVFIEKLQNIVGLKPKNIHIIGHSLGSHIAGFAGKRINKIGRITALDPAGPSFTDVDPTDRLDRNDALFVDVIHTDMAPNVFTGLGLMESIGHIDFFPNAGYEQPGCKYMGYAMLTFIKSPLFNRNELTEIQCNHKRAIDLFISSFRNTGCQLWAAVCSYWEDYSYGKCGTCKDGQDGECIPLGIHADQYASKVKNDESITALLSTTDKEPFC